MTGSVVVLGGPDSGKSNYIARLWPALEEKRGDLVRTVQPPNIEFVLEAAEHLFRGQFIQRSEHADERRIFEITVAPAAGGAETTIVIPDVSGELWRKAAAEFELPEDMMRDLGDAAGALLFLREGSDQNVSPLDAVTSKKMLAKLGSVDDSGLPTQVMLCELIRLLEFSLLKRADGSVPRLAVVISAWDLVGPEEFERGPLEYLDREYPMLAGRIADLERLEVRVFGLSVVGGDLSENGFRDRFLDEGMDGSGWIAVQDIASGTWRKDPDITKPVAWAIGI